MLSHLHRSPTFFSIQVLLFVSSVKRREAMSWLSNPPLYSQDYLDEGYVPPRPYSGLSNDCHNPSSNNTNNTSSNANEGGSIVGEIYVRESSFLKEEERVSGPAARASSFLRF